MNLTKKIILTLAVLAIAGADHAQQTDTTNQSAIIPPPANNSQPASTSTAGGILGKRYVDANFSLQDIRHVSKNAYDLGVGANIPVSPGIDLGAAYDHSWLQGTSTTPRVHSDVIQGTVTLFPPARTFDSDVKPFVAGGIGYQWDNAKFSGTPHSFTFGSSDDYAIWGLAVGLEIPVDALSITPVVSYSDDFRSSHQSVQAFNYGAEANYWITNQVGVYAAATYQDVRHSSFDSWIYTTGVRFQF
jgi:hypothetical protein